MNNCYLFNARNGSGGGNMVNRNSRLIVRRHAALGDSLCATVVADRLISLGHEVTFQSHPTAHCILRRHPLISSIEESGGQADVDLDQSYERDPNRRLKHFHWMFFEAAQRQLDHRGIKLGAPYNCRPQIKVSRNEQQGAREFLAGYARPWVFICPRSDSYNVRQVTDGTWQAAAALMAGTKFWIGRYPGPPGIVDLKIQHFDYVIQYLAVADLLVTVDTGPMHVAAAMGVPVVAINQSSSPELHLSDQCDFVTVSPPLDCLNCQLNICPKNTHLPPCQYLDPALIAQWVNARLSARFSNEVSAIISIYQPEVGVLNHCLDNVLPQVSEVIISVDSKGIVPDGMRQDPRIRVVHKAISDIGYGRKINHGVRHSNGKFLLLLNDDVFLAGDAVARMMDVMRDGVGMVANLLWYPVGVIYHAGKARTPGVRAWGHIDLRHRVPSIKQPVEMENVCGACVLVRREAFYQIGAFDEDYYLYAEDDDFSLRMRKYGWKIIYTPHSTGVHMEHQSTRKTANISEVVARANAVFTSKWGEYLEWNLNRVPGNFDYLKV